MKAKILLGLRRLSIIPIASSAVYLIPALGAIWLFTWRNYAGELLDWCGDAIEGKPPRGSAGKVVICAWLIIVNIIAWGYDHRKAQAIKDSYINSNHAHHKIYQYVNATLPLDARVLLVGVTDRYYLRRDSYRSGPVYGALSKVTSYHPYRSENDVIDSIKKLRIKYAIIAPNATYLDVAEADVGRARELQGAYLGMVALEKAAIEGHHKLLHMENGYRLVEFVFEK